MHHCRCVIMAKVTPFTGKYSYCLVTDSKEIGTRHCHEWADFYWLNNCYYWHTPWQH